MQVLLGFPSQSVRSKNIALLFLHGSFHGSWCWQEHFLPYFVDAGYTVVAPDWRGTGGTPAAPGARKVKIAQHVQDLHCLVEQLPKLLEHQTSGAHITNPHPVVVAHSFGGVALMKYLEEHRGNDNPFCGVVTFCSVPPSGNGQLTMRYLQRSLRTSWIITRGFAMKKCITDEDMCRQLFFGGPKETNDNGKVDDFGVSDQEIRTYQQNFLRDSAATIDLLNLSKKLPSLLTDSDGKSLFVNDEFPSCLVVGAKDDYIVDTEAVEETAVYFGASPPIIVESPHDIMLGRNWMKAAKTLKTWLDKTIEK